VTDVIDLDHVAVAVEDYADAWPRLGRDLAGEWLTDAGGTGFAFAQLRYLNGMKVEVLRPDRVETNDFLRRFLAHSGPGPHHLTFKVPDLDDALERARSAGYQPVGVNRSEPDWQEAFLHPRDIPGVVVQMAQVSGGEWTTSPPPGFPAPRTQRAATLDWVAHAVANLDEGLRLFAGLLHGVQVAEGIDHEASWVELAWPGPGRVRLLAPTSPSSPVATWMGGRRGRVHHVAFTCENPADIVGATARPDLTYEIAPEANLGVRLILRPR
jgi:methylmalonyl-CoA/ethylmalonyl-CoA epimerase